VVAVNIVGTFDGFVAGFCSPTKGLGLELMAGFGANGAFLG